MWASCLYLCDFILYQRQLFDAAVVVELGAGVGLASIVASLYANRIFSTGFVFTVNSIQVRSIKLLLDLNANLGRHQMSSVAEA